MPRWRPSWASSRPSRTARAKERRQPRSRADSSPGDRERSGLDVGRGRQMVAQLLRRHVAGRDVPLPELLESEVLFAARTGDPELLRAAAREDGTPRMEPAPARDP